MSSAPRLALISLSILASTAPFVSGCVYGRTTLVSQNACSSYIGPTLRRRIESAGIPAENAGIGDYAVLLDGQTARLGQANDRGDAVIEICDNVDRLNREAAARITAPWWKRLFGG